MTGVEIGHAKIIAERNKLITTIQLENCQDGKTVQPKENV